MFWNVQPGDVSVLGDEKEMMSAGIFSMVPANRIWRRSFSFRDGFHWKRDDWSHIHWVMKTIIWRDGSVHRYDDYCGP